MSTATQLPFAVMVIHECDFYRIHCTRHGYFNVTVKRGKDFKRNCPLCAREVGIAAFAVGATNRQTLPYVEGPIGEGRAKVPSKYRGGRPIKTHTGKPK